MALRRSLSPSSWTCHSCQSSLLRSFAPISGIQSPPRRRFSSIPPRRSEQLLSAHEKDLQNGDPLPESPFQWTEAPKSPKTPIETTTEYTPWYLQVQPKTTPININSPLANKHLIPSLPASSPPILSPLLQHLSTTIGLDTLSLLDLRSLDPPAALGSNLLMIVGTARSEKHLHVSADRFCRYLRSEYNMNPFADGLLGRNEFKLKVRRKNRRAKMMASVGVGGGGGKGSGLGTGGKEGEGMVDDGIRTGWVCVIAGKVDPAPAPAPTTLPGEVEEVKKPENIKGFVGFGEKSDKITLVVQMFTEEKRAETDLEGLWGRLLERSERMRLHREDEKGEAEALERRLGMSVETEDGVEGKGTDALEGYFAEMDLEGREERVSAR
ncbi:hypothetical protein EJ08DRAFT_333633 [Tothia fuscella]|uniref:ATPase synthesis protein 25 n=1 Tax=Tothia fuscella TaxID=1048955 RepID=A0A9P4TWP3_9PEZI|nr:hypothetical protein EJ08DRAFT_333633 [Tothia fuscella]